MISSDVFQTLDELSKHPEFKAPVIVIAFSDVEKAWQAHAQALGIEDDETAERYMWAIHDCQLEGGQALIKRGIHDDEKIHLHDNARERALALAGQVHQPVILEMNALALNAKLAGIEDADVIGFVRRLKKHAAAAVPFKVVN